MGNLNDAYNEAEKSGLIIPHEAPERRVHMGSSRIDSAIAPLNAQGQTCRLPSGREVSFIIPPDATISLDKEYFIGRKSPVHDEIFLPLGAIHMRPAGRYETIYRLKGESVWMLEKAFDARIKGGMYRQ